MNATNLDKLRQDFLSTRQALIKAQKARAPEPVDDYQFETSDGSVALSSLFHNKPELFVIHNMGISCNYCTLWADGLNGMIDHIQSRAAIVLSSPDAVDIQQQYKKQRNWRFDMVSTANNSFAQDMGYRNADGPHPGVSIFTISDGTITRVADTPFGPGDDYCAVWHLFDLLPDGANGWQPQQAY